MLDDDLQLRLLTPDPIYVDSVPIQYVSLHKIAQIGYTNYRLMLGSLCITQSAIQKLIQSDTENISPCSFLYINALANESFWQVLRDGLELFTGYKPLLSDQMIEFTFDDFVVNNDNFTKVQEMICIRNAVKEAEEEISENPADEYARRLLERRKEVREKLAKVKNKNSDSLNLADLISIFSSGMKIPIREVIEYDMYQFDDQFSRMKMFDDYQMGVQAILHGAKSEDINLKHWICKLNEESE